LTENGHAIPTNTDAVSVRSRILKLVDEDNLDPHDIAEAIMEDLDLYETQTAMKELLNMPQLLI